ncbi:MAG: PEP-CTERM sorting domain-containing protein, partial [Terriglobia bacterium]
ASGLQNFLGASFDILNFGSLAGQFTNFDFIMSNNTALPFGYTWDVSDPSGSLAIVWSQIPNCTAAGEAVLNGDQTPAGCSTWPPGVTLHPPTFTPTPIVLTPQAAPEPGTLALLVMGLLGLAWFVRNANLDSPQW